MRCPTHPSPLPPCRLLCSRGEAILVQRYISTRPMFTNLRELQFVAAQQQQQQQQAAAGGGGGGSSSSGAAGSAQAAAEAEAVAADLAALRGLSSLYKSILSTMRDEAVVIEQVGGQGRAGGVAAAGCRLPGSMVCGPLELPFVLYRLLALVCAPPPPRRCFPRRTAPSRSTSSECLSRRCRQQWTRCCGRRQLGRGTPRCAPACASWPRCIARRGAWRTTCRQARQAGWQAGRLAGWQAGGRVASMLQSVRWRAGAGLR